MEWKISSSASSNQSLQEAAEDFQPEHTAKTQHQVENKVVTEPPILPEEAMEKASTAERSNEAADFEALLQRQDTDSFYSPLSKTFSRGSTSAASSRTSMDSLSSEPRNSGEHFPFLFENDEGTVSKLTLKRNSINSIPIGYRPSSAELTQHKGGIRPKSKIASAQTPRTDSGVKPLSYKPDREESGRSDVQKSEHFNEAVIDNFILPKTTYTP